MSPGAGGGGSGDAHAGRPLAARRALGTPERGDDVVADAGRQRRRLHAARTVVLEAGPAMHGALFCRPGTRIGELCDDNPTGHEWCVERFHALGMRTLLFPCAAVGPPGGLEGAVEKRADPDRLDACLAALESGPPHFGESR